jgi:hypothetical protein
MLKWGVVYVGTIAFAGAASGSHAESVERCNGYTRCRHDSEGGDSL